jgi:hypothetical protein
MTTQPKIFVWGMSIFTIFITAITACSNQVSTLPEPQTVATQTTTDKEENATVDVCTPLKSPDIAFLRQEAAEGPREVMEAELVGNLVLEDGYLKIESIYGNQSYLPIWPPEFTLSLDSDETEILDGDDVVVGRVGEEIYMGGGTGSLNSLSDCVRQQLPGYCDDPIWVVGDGVRPNIQSDSEFVQIEVISTTESTGFLITKKALLDEWVEETSTISGILSMYTPQRCPRIQSESGITDYLPIWPPEYSLYFKDGKVEVADGNGKVIASEGSDLLVNGGSIPHSWDSEAYRQLYYDVPGDCFGPYWIVSE